MPLLEARKQYKPFEYPWAFDFWKRQQQIHWMPEEVPLGEDCRDWAQKLTEHETNLLTQIFRFFTQADIEVQDCYHDKYGRVFKPVEVKMMLTAFSNMETVHIAAYSHLLDTIGMPESEYGMFLQYKEMKDKHDYLATFGVDSDEDIARTLAMFGGFTEGLQLFASFAMLMNFPRFNKMKGMGQIVSWSVRDESLHCEGITRLFHAFVKERDCMNKAVADDIRDVCHKTVGLEDAFIDLAFETGPGPRHDPQGDQEIYPLHRRLAARPIGPQADVHDRRAPVALAGAFAQRRGARQFLRDPRDRIFQGRDARELGRGLGQFRQAPERQGGERRGRLGRRSFGEGGWRGYVHPGRRRRGMRELGRGLGQRSLPGADEADKRQNAKAANDGSSAEASAKADDDMFTRAGVAAE